LANGPYRQPATSQQLVEPLMNLWRRAGAARYGESPLALLLLVFLVVAVAYSIAIPLFEGPDEDDHFRYVRYLAYHRALPVQLFQAGGGEAGHQGWQPPLYYGLVALVISPVDTSDFEQHLWRNPGTSFQGDRACCGRNLYFHARSEDFPYTFTTLAVHLARFVTILFGLITVATVYALMLTILPRQPWGALAAAAVVGFNPSFLFASALVSNDVPLAALCSLTLLICAKLLRRALEPNLKNFALLGITIALAVLVKTTALGLIPIALAVAAWRAIELRERIPAGAQILMNALIGILAPIFLLTGWWFVRNQILYGDPMAYRLVYASAIFPRDSPLTWPELFRINLPWLWQTFWGGPTPGDLASSLLIILLALSLLAAVGAVLFLVSSKDNGARAGLVLLVIWLGLIVAAQIQFIRTSGGTDQGRYLFPAIASFAILWVLGLDVWVSLMASRVFGRTRDKTFTPPRAHTPILSVTCISAFVALALFALFANTIPAYARPPQLTEAILVHADKQLDANFSNLFALRGYSLSTRTLRPGDAISVTLYWQSLGSTRISYRVFVHLVGENGHVAGGKDVVPGQGAYATVLWQPGDWIQDTITFTTARDAVAGVYQLEVGLYPYGQPDDRLNLAGSDEDHVLVDAIEVRD
jgi:dolichyl-phosphate-mannose-protein mannosyltransferase